MDKIILTQFLNKEYITGIGLTVIMTILLIQGIDRLEEENKNSTQQHYKQILLALKNVDHTIETPNTIFLCAKKTESEFSMFCEKCDWLLFYVHNSPDQDLKNMALEIFKNSCDGKKNYSIEN